jgi:hypothetical protein
MNALRWIAVLPAAILGSLIVQTINALLGYFVPDVLMQIWNSWSGFLAFVLAGFYVAPKNKFITALVLTVLYSVFIGAFLVLGLNPRYHGTPAWLLIVCGVLSLVGATMSCLLAKEMEATKEKELEAEATSRAEQARSWQEAREREQSSQN